MNINSDVRANQQVVEYGKFVEIQNSTSFPAISVTRSDSSVPSVTSVSVYPKYAVLTYDIGLSTGIAFADAATIDAFGKLRVTQPYTIFDSKPLHATNSLTFNTIVSGSGGCVYTASDTSITLSANTTNSYAIRQTKLRCPYQSGKSQLAMFTGILTPETNIIKRYGLFNSLTAAPYDPEVGLFFEASNNTVSVVQFNNSSLVSSVSATQAQWNIDPLDGTGSSGITLDFTKIQIFVIDYAWLGAGRVRFGFNIDGTTYYCHEFLNANNKNSAYIKTPNLSVRAELRQVGSGSGTLKAICQTVISEGGHGNPATTGAVKSVDTGSTGLDIATAGVRRAILGLRLQSQKLDSANALLSVSTLLLPSGASSEMPYRVELVLNPTLSGTAFSWQDVADSSLQYAAATDNTTGLNGGTVILSAVISKQTAIDISNEVMQRSLRLGCSIDGIRDAIYLVVTPLASAAANSCWGSFTFVDAD